MEYLLLLLLLMMMMMMMMMTMMMMQIVIIYRDDDDYIVFDLCCLGQAAYAHLQFLDVLWPDLGLWDLAMCILQYQRAIPQLTALRTLRTIGSSTASSKVCSACQSLKPLILSQPGNSSADLHTCRVCDFLRIRRARAAAALDLLAVPSRAASGGIH
jgi:hypothetical protein